MKKDIYIVSAQRTAVAKACKGLKEFTAAQMGAAVVKEILRAQKISGEEISEVIFGNAVGAGTGQNLARQVVSAAGMPLNTPAFVVNAVCGSGLEAMILGCQAIWAGEAQAMIAGGAESATHAPLFVDQSETADAARAPKESGFYDGLLCSITGKPMGVLCEELVRDNNISRQAQDQFALESHQKACAARDSGKFKNEIIAVQTSQGIFDADERPRLRMDLSRLTDLPPAFGENGTITAGNSSAPADGAAAFLLASEEWIAKKKVKPCARILGYVSLALDPRVIFTGAAHAVENVLQKTKLTVKDIDLFEITESFSAQAIYTRDKLGIPSEKMNIFGGDVALGHPLAAAGSRALVTLVHALISQKKKRGLVSVCFGGGGAIAMVIENTF